MTYKRINPTPALSDLVEYFGIQVSDELSDAVTRVLPTNQHDLLIHFADPFKHHDADSVTTEPIAHLCGQRTKPYTVSASGQTGIVVCSFFPWAVSELSSVSMSYITDTTVEAQEIFNGIQPVIERILCSESHEAKIKLLEDYLLSLLKKPDLLIRRGTELLRHQNLNIRELSDSLGISKRQLDRRFMAATGLTPKTFARVTRFQQALSFRHHHLSPANIATHCGYYDQAHMNRDIKLMGGKTPKQILNQSDSTPLLSRFNAPNLNVSRFYNTLYLQ